MRHTFEETKIEIVWGQQCPFTENQMDQKMHYIFDFSKIGDKLKTDKLKSHKACPMAMWKCRNKAEDKYKT